MVLWVVARQSPLQMSMQCHQIQVGLQWVVVMHHLLLHRRLGVMPWTTHLAAAISAAFSNPVALPIRNPPAGFVQILAVTEHQIDGPGEESAAVNRELLEIGDVIVTEA